MSTTSPNDPYLDRLRRVYVPWFRMRLTRSVCGTR